MDWSVKDSYGWRNDPDSVKALVQADSQASLDKLHNMAHLLTIQAGASVPNEYKVSEQPSITYCWYWGCSDICTGLRFAVNRWWLVSSSSLTMLYFIISMLAVTVYRKLPRPIPEAEAAVEADIEDGAPKALTFPVIDAPSFGRRKRRLRKNPSGLVF